MLACARLGEAVLGSCGACPTDGRAKRPDARTAPVLGPPRPSRGRHPCGPRSMVPRGVSVAWGSGLPGGRRAPSLEVSVPHAPQSARELALPGAWLVHVCGHADLADCPGRPPVSEVC